MKKFYVNCGDVHTVILGDDHMDAAVRAFRKFREMEDLPALGALVGVSEKTFDVMEYDDDDCFIFTPIVMKKADVCDLYNYDVPDIE